MAKSKKTIKEAKNSDLVYNIEPVHFAATGVKELSFFIRENFFIPGDNEMTVNYGNSLVFNSDTNVLEFILRAEFNYKNHTTDTLFAIDVQNLFILPEMKKYINHEGKLKLPDWFLVDIVRISVGHTRALLAKHTNETVYNNILIPIVNANEMAAAFFGFKSQLQ